MHEIYFHVSYLGPTEDHSLLTPVNYKQSKVSLLVEKVIGDVEKKRPFYYYFPNIVNYWKEFKSLKPAVVVIRDPYTCFSLVAAFCALFNKSKIIFYTQEELNRYRTTFTFFKQMLTISFFKAAWMTPLLGEHHFKHPKHMYYVPLPIPIQSANILVGKESITVPHFLMIGKYHQERKKHLLLLEAVSILKDRYKFKVTMAGECVTKKQMERYRMIEDLVQRKCLSNFVELKTNVPFPQMAELYASHHVFVLPSINEPYSISVLEALAYGLPVICTDTCGSSIHIRNNENGFIVKSSSLEELTAALEAFLSNASKVRAMSSKALSYVEQNLSGQACYSKFSGLIEKRFKIQTPKREKDLN